MKPRSKVIEMSVDHITKHLNRVTDDNFQNIIVITGRTGSGKSTLGIQMAIQGDPNFTLEKNVLFNPEFSEVMSKVRSLPYGSYIILDEAIKIAYKLEWYSEINRLLDKFFNLCRKERKTIIFCIPRFNDLTKSFREMTNLWFNVLKRGEAVGLTGNPFFMSTSKWDLDGLLKYMNKCAGFKRYAEIETGDISFYLRRNQHYFCNIKFDKLPAKVEAEYEILRDQVKYDGLEIAEKKKQEILRDYRYLLYRLNIPQTFVSIFEGLHSTSVNKSISRLSQDRKKEIDIMINNFLQKNHKNKLDSLPKADINSIKVLFEDENQPNNQPLHNIPIMCSKEDENGDAE